MPTSSDEFLETLNETELYQVCLNADLRISPASSKEDMIAYLLGTKEPPEEPHEIDAWRRGIMGFLLDYWKVMEAQLKCPAKSGDPKACFQCLDTQVITCIVTNAPAEQHIRKHKKYHDS